MSLSNWLSDKPKIQIEDFKQVQNRKQHEQLTSIREVTPRNKSKIVESIRLISEYLVWSEQNAQQFFQQIPLSYFIQMNTMQEMINLLYRQSNRAVTLQILQSVSILCHNLNDKHSLEHIYQNLEPFLLYQYDFTDEEILENFSAMLKGLTLNINADNVDYFFNNEGCPLLYQAVMLYNHEDSLVRTTCRTAALNLMKCKFQIVQHSKMKLALHKTGFIVNFICYIRQQLVILEQYSDQANQATYSEVDNLVVDFIDNLYYLNDIFENCPEQLSNTVIEYFCRYLLFPMVLGSVCSERHAKYHAPLPLSLFTLANLLSIVRHPIFCNAIVSVIIMKKVSVDLIKLTNTAPPENPVNFSYRCRPDIQSQNANIEKLENYYVLDTLGKMYQYIENPNEEEESIVENISSQIFFSFLRVSYNQSRDDNFITLTLLLLQSIIINPSISKKLLIQAGVHPVNINRQLNAENLEEMKDRPIGQYSNQLVQYLLNLINVEPGFRLITCYLALKMIYYLTYDPKCPRCLKPDHEFLLTQALKQSIQNINQYLNNPHVNQKIMDLFEQEWKVVANLKFNEKVPIPSHLLLSMVDLTSLSISYTQKPVSNDQENLRYNIHIFFLLRKLRYLLCQEDIPSDYNFDEYPLSYLKPHNDWQMGSTYEVDPESCTRCNLKIGAIHSVCYIVENEDYFILAEPDQFSFQKVKATHVYSLRSVEIMEDRSDPRALCIMSRVSNIQLLLSLENPAKALQVKRDLEAKKKQSSDFELSLVAAFLSSLESSF